MNAYYLTATKYIDLDAPQHLMFATSSSSLRLGFIVHHSDGHVNGSPDTLEYLSKRYDTSLYTTVLRLYPELLI